MNAQDTRDLKSVERTLGELTASMRALSDQVAFNHEAARDSRIDLANSLKENGERLDVVAGKVAKIEDRAFLGFRAILALGGITASVLGFFGWQQISAWLPHVKP